MVWSSCASHSICLRAVVGGRSERIQIPCVCSGVCAVWLTARLVARFFCGTMGSGSYLAGMAVTRLEARGAAAEAVLGAMVERRRKAEKRRAEL